jgi:hypothetical protein
VSEDVGCCFNKGHQLLSPLVSRVIRFHLLVLLCMHMHTGHVEGEERRVWPVLCVLTSTLCKAEPTQPQLGFSLPVCAHTVRHCLHTVVGHLLVVDMACGMFVAVVV